MVLARTNDACLEAFSPSKRLRFLYADVSETARRLAAAHSAGLSSGQLAKDSSVYEISVKRVGKDTCYELRIPWVDAGGVRPQPGTRLGLSLRLTDADTASSATGPPAATAA